MLSLARMPARIYAVGDIHGCLPLFLTLEALIAQDAADVEGTKLIVLLGDMVDRGPKSAALIDHLMAPPPSGFNRLALLGNHEDMMLNFLQDPIRQRRWLTFGGRETLMSYGMQPDPRHEFALPAPRINQMIQAHIPTAHIEWLKNLPASFQVGPYLLAHAGYDPSKMIEEQQKDDLIWGNPGRLDAVRSPFVAVHGHVPVELAHVGENRINVDTGAYYSGLLSAVCLTPDEPPRLLTTPHRNTAKATTHS